MADPMQIARGEAWKYSWRVTRDGAAIDGDRVVNAWLSRTFKGDPVTPESVLPLSRGRLLLRADEREIWSAPLHADAVTAALASIFTGYTVWEVIEIDGERKSNALTVVD